MTEGVAGLLRDKTDPPHSATRHCAIEQRVVTRTLGEPPDETTHWTAPRWPRKMASASVRCSASGADMVCSRTELGRVCP
jgi:hypothetical protein